VNEKKAEINKLSDLQDEIRELLHESFGRPRWVVAEISEIKENFSGHCYLDLVEKDEQSDKLLAKARATIWSSAYRMLKPFFETSTGYELTAGIKIMVSASVEYHPVYGLSLNIRDIDPSYTLGDVERKRQEIISRLEKEGVLTMNRETGLPEVPQKIAVISSETAAGYEDFLRQLENNSYGYRFYTKLYPASMQGDTAESSIINALEKIFEYEDLFDAVVIIRGGGSRSDLACFDSYELAFHVTQFPLPVLTGIGHEQDETITDMVAHTKLKTPTAVAEFLVDRLSSFEGRLDEAAETLVRTIRSILHEKNLHLELSRQKIISGSAAFMRDLAEGLLRRTTDARHLVRNSITEYSLGMLRLTEQLKNSAGIIRERKTLETVHTMSRLKQASLNLAERERKRLDNHARLNAYADPAQVLKLGFSIARYKGKALKDTDKLKKDDTIETELSRGKIESKVTGLKKKLYIRSSEKR
jgi:exodeoxyribonuclease VII large subunit